MNSKSGFITLSTGVVSVGLLVSTWMLLKSVRKRRDGDDDDVKEKKGTSNNVDDFSMDNTDGHSDPAEGQWSDHLPSHIIREQMKERRRKAKIPLLAMKKQMYDNITMLDPQGQTLSKISKKKARWYVNKKGLAIWVKNGDAKSGICECSGGEESDFIQLKFEPKARSADEDYGKSIKQNMCVACGETEHQMRFYIVPFAYRHLFPKRYKSHISHDVVSLCANCHLRCGQQTQIRMNDLEERYMPKKKYSTNHDLYKVRSAALALMNWRHKIPAERIAIHEEVVRKYLVAEGDLNEENNGAEGGGEEEVISKKLLQKAIDVDYRVLNPTFVPGPELVVQDLVGGEDEDEDHEKLAIFIREWRQFFLETIHPRYLPKGWSVDYPVVSGR